MSLRYIIDAYNLINHPLFNPRSRKLSDPRRALADFIISNKLTGSRKNKVVLVFDGYPPTEETPAEEGLTCLFSRMIEADDLIRKLLEESGRTSEIIVVSDDRQVQESARMFRAGVCSVEVFICAKNVRGRGSAGAEEDTKVSYSKMQIINEELKKRWLE